MKKKYVLCTIFSSLIIGIAIAVSWYITPKVFLKNVDTASIASISVFNGSTGQQMILEDPEQITVIVDNIQSAKMKRGKISSNYDGFSFSLTFKDKSGKVVDSFIINSNSVIRDDPFFYECKSGELCYTLLQELESIYGIQR